jgi:hypothetical protein
MKDNKEKTKPQDTFHKKLYREVNASYLQDILDDLTYRMGYGRVYPIKDPQGYITDWRGSKTFFPPWMRNIHEFGNPQHIVKGIKNIFAGKKISKRMEEILWGLVSDKRSETARVIVGERRERRTGNYPFKDCA